MSIRRYVVAALIALWLGLPASAHAEQILLTFEGLGFMTPRACVEQIGDFYNGGFGVAVCGETAHGPGPNFGVTFSPRAFAMIDIDAGGNGNINGEPSPSTVLYLPDEPIVMNVPRGIASNTFRAHYASPFNSGAIQLYEQLNGTGVLIDDLFLPPSPLGPGDPTGVFGPYVQVRGSKTGVAQSVVFFGQPDQISFDDVAFETSAPVPEPSMLFLVAAAGLGAIRTHRHRRQQQANRRPVQ